MQHLRRSSHRRNLSAAGRKFGPGLGRERESVGLAVGQPRERTAEVLARELLAERLGDLVIELFEVVQAPGDPGERVEVVGREHLALDDREEDLDLVSQLAWIGVWRRMRFGQRPCRRRTDAWPRCEEPLSTIQNTRGADA